MRRKAVESRTMKSVGYESKSRILEIEFTSGEVYQYVDVPEMVHKKLLQAKSKGQYFNSDIRDDYTCIRLDARRRGTSW